MKYTVLLVDDEPIVLQSIRRVLKRFYDIETAVRGADGLDIIRDKNIAAVIADQNMPGMDGVTFLSKVRELAPGAIRIMLSGNRDFDTSIRAVNEGAVYRFLTKPFPAKALIEVLDTAMEQYELNREIAENAAMRNQAENTLSVCSYCTKVREPEKTPDDPMSWERIELFLSRRFGFRFSHCVCPDCVNKLYAELEEQKKRAKEQQPQSVIES